MAGNDRKEEEFEAFDYDEEDEGAFDDGFPLDDAEQTQDTIQVLPFQDETDVRGAMTIIQPPPRSGGKNGGGDGVFVRMDEVLEEQDDDGLDEQERQLRQKAEELTPDQVYQQTFADQPAMPKGAPVYHTPFGERIVQPQRYSRHTRTIIQRERDLVRTAELYLEGNSQVRIAEILSSERDYSLNYRTIWKDLQEIHRRWRAAYIESTHTAKLRELAKLDRLEQEYWDAWRQSRADSLAVSQERETDEEEAVRGGMRPVARRTKSKTKKEKRSGEVEFLKGIERCIEKRCTILGLNQHTVNVNWRKEASAAGFNPEAVIDGLVEQFLAASQSPDSLGGSSSRGSLEEI